MPSYICKLTDPKDGAVVYFEWSSIVDAPVTYGMTLDEFKAYYKEEYGVQGVRTLEERLERVEAKGTSAMLYDSAEELIANNHAGPEGSESSLREILVKLRSDPDSKTYSSGTG